MQEVVVDEEERQVLPGPGTYGDIYKNSDFGKKTAPDRL
jgi:hypothetical protein